MFGFFKRKPKREIAPLDPEQQRFLNRCIGAARGVGLNAVGTERFSIRVSVGMRIIAQELPIEPYWFAYADTGDMRIFNRVAKHARALCAA